MKTDYYELLGVSSSVNDSELKKAYRKKALVYHPDKNRENIEEATMRFALIRSAYEVLSDPQERAWYDSHKSQILREDNDRYDDDDVYVEPEIAGTTVEEILKFFDPSLYTRKDNSPYGMYAMMTQLFNKLAEEDVLAGTQQGLDGYAKYQDDDHYDTTNNLYPKFGNTDSDYASQVRKFYQVWGSFSTVKTFSWKDEYRYSTAGDRRTRRAMEKENKKARDLAKREFNETVRNFVSFIKKRDPRVKEGAAQFEQERKRKQQEDLRKQIERDRQANAALRNQFQEQSWQMLDDEQLADMEGRFLSDSEQDEEGEDQHVFECVICDKIFKTERQFQAHESSTKHKKLLKKLKWEMKQEGISLGIDSVSDESEFETADEEEINLSDSDIQDPDDFSDLEDFSDMDGYGDDIDQELRKIEEQLKSMDLEEKDDEQKDITPQEPENVEVDDDLSDIDDNISPDEEQAAPKKLSKKEKKKKKYGRPAPKADLEEDELSKLAAALEKGKGLDADASDDDWGSSKKEKKKKSKKTGSMFSNSGSTTPQPQPQSKPKEPMGASEKCSVCNTSFPSRNKLFQHVKATGHAAPPPKKKGKKKK
jgi:DnaJ family protein A protein 5